MESGQAYFARHDGLIVLKLVGDIRYTMGTTYRVSASLDRLLDKLFDEADFDNFLIDLRETTSIDSTNLGLLAKVSRHMRKEYGRRPTILSTNEDINALLHSVGFDKVFLIVHDAEHPEVELDRLPEDCAADKEMGRVVLEAHRALVELNEKNQRSFQKVVEVLEGELGRSQGE